MDGQMNELINGQFYAWIGSRQIINEQVNINEGNEYFIGKMYTH